MDVTTKAIALRATDYKEHDKFVVLYTANFPCVHAGCVGVMQRSGMPPISFASATTSLQLAVIATPFVIASS